MRPLGPHLAILFIMVQDSKALPALRLSGLCSVHASTYVTTAINVASWSSRATATCGTATRPSSATPAFSALSTTPPASSIPAIVPFTAAAASACGCGVDALEAYASRAVANVRSKQRERAYSLVWVGFGSHITSGD